MLEKQNGGNHEERRKNGEVAKPKRTKNTIKSVSSFIIVLDFVAQNPNAMIIVICFVCGLTLHHHFCRSGTSTQ
jgi:hypothetical protein